MRVRPAGREACNCASPYNSILERLDAMEAEILTAMQEANTAVGIANAALRQVQAAGIRTVNQIQPDTDGEFSITAGTGIQINAGTNGIEIENTSQGAIYTGISPIDINEDNEISLKGWTVYDSTDWSGFIETGEDNITRVTEDLVLVVGRRDTMRGIFFFHKGMMVYQFSSDTPLIALFHYYDMKVKEIFTNSASTKLYNYGLRTSNVGSGALQNAYLTMDQDPTEYTVTKLTNANLLFGVYSAYLLRRA